MKIEQHAQGQWIATGKYRGRDYICEGRTRDEARLEAMLCMADIQAEVPIPDNVRRFPRKREDQTR